MRQFIVFIHIERAGGTSLHHLLHYNFKNYFTINPRNLRTNNQDSFFRKKNLENLLKKYPECSGIGGHTTRSFLGYADILQYPIFYLTFLRDPVHRYLSHFNYQKNVMKINWKFEDFLATKYFNNFQCKRLVNRENPQEAFQELKKYAFVGLTDHYNESLLMLKESIDWCAFDPRYEKKIKFPRVTKILNFMNCLLTFRIKS